MAHALIIGAGIIGGAIALELARAGWAVTVVDKGAEAGHGSTSDSSSIIRINYSVAETSAMALEGWHIWRDWAGYLGDLGDLGDRPLARYRETGALVIHDPDGPGLGHITAIMDQIGGRYTRLSTGEIAAMLPGADLRSYAPARPLDAADFAEAQAPAIGGGVFFPQAGYVNDPKLAAQNLQWAAEALGVRFRFRQRVTAIARENGRVAGVRVVPADDSLAEPTLIPADVVVNAAGPWSSGINDMAGVTDDMTIRSRPHRHEVAVIPGPREMDFHRDGVVIADLDAGVYMRPDPAGICIGSTDPECDPAIWIDDPDGLDPSFSDAWNAIVMRAAQRLPSLPVPNGARGVVALYDTSDDWLPIYDRSSLPGFYLACGTSGNQFKNAPVVGRAMATLIAAVEAGQDHDADPVHLDLPRSGLRVDLSVYSRRRAINRGSSFSVMG